MSRYYSRMRPVTPGSYPREGVREIVNFDDKTYCEEIEDEAWGYIEYDRELTEEEAESWELTAAEAKTWYEVTVAYFNNGKVFSQITGSRKAARKPEPSEKHYKDKDIFTDWFDSHEEAEGCCRRSKET